MSTAPVSSPSVSALTAAGRSATTRPGRPLLSAPVAPAARPVQPAQPARQVQPTTVTVRRMLRTFERVVLREGGHRGALVNAHAAVLEGEQRAALRADARESLQRLATPTD